MNKILLYRCPACYKAFNSKAKLTRHLWLNGSEYFIPTIDQYKLGSK